MSTHTLRRRPLRSVSEPGEGKVLRNLSPLAAAAMSQREGSLPRGRGADARLLTEPSLPPGSVRTVSSSRRGGGKHPAGPETASGPEGAWALPPGREDPACYRQSPVS